MWKYRNSSKPTTGHMTSWSTRTAVTSDRSGWGFTIKQGGRTVHDDCSATQSHDLQSDHVSRCSHTCIIVASLPALRTDYACCYSYRLNEPPEKGESGNCLSWLAHSHERVSTAQNSVICCPEHAGVRVNERTDRLASTTDIARSLQLGRAEGRRGLGNFLNMDRSEQKEQDGKRGGERKRSIFHPPRLGTICVLNHAAIGTVSRATLEGLLRDWTEHAMAFPSSRMPSLAEAAAEVEWWFYYMWQEHSNNQA